MKANLKSLYAILAMVPLAVSTLPATAVVMPLIADTVIRNVGLDDDDNFGSAGFLSVSTGDANNLQRTLLQFDVSSIAPGSTINSAVLTLTADSSLFSGGNPTGQSMEVFRLFKSWNESQATWLGPTTGFTWATAPPPGGSSAGGSFVGSNHGVPPDPAYATANNTLANGYGTAQITWNVTSLVDDWVNGGDPNNGLLIRSFTGNQLHFRSSENINGSGPSLDVTFTPVPEPMQLALVSSLALAGFAGYRRFRSTHRQVK